MKDLFSPYELAVLLNEKGFNEECLAVYSSNGKFQIVTGRMMVSTNNTDAKKVNFITAPLWQQITDWLRDKHKIIIVIDFCIDNNEIEYMVNVSEPNTRHEKDYMTAVSFISYYNALESGIKEALELI